MKHLLTLLTTLLSTIALCQYPITENFTTSTTGWTFTNGSGIQNGAYATFNINTTPYPNDSQINIISPLYDFSDCVDLEVSFSWYSQMPDAGDNWSFQYFSGGVWTTVETWSNNLSTGWTIETYSIPTTTTQLQWVLTTDSADPQTMVVGNGANATTVSWDASTQTISTQGNTSTTYVNFVDFNYITIDCLNGLPVELVDFNANHVESYNYITWKTVSEQNTSHFLLKRSTTLEFDENSVIEYIPAAGNSNQLLNYESVDRSYDNVINYYQLVQVDLNGQSVEYGPISVDNRDAEHVIRRVNLLGQEVDSDYSGIIIEIDQFGNITKTIK